jgi:hypothetical protein
MSVIAAANCFNSTLSASVVSAEIVSGRFGVGEREIEGVSCIYDNQLGKRRKLLEKNEPLSLQ